MLLLRETSIPRKVHNRINTTGLPFITGERVRILDHRVPQSRSLLQLTSILHRCIAGTVLSQVRRDQSLQDVWKQGLLRRRECAERVQLLLKEASSSSFHVISANPQSTAGINTTKPVSVATLRTATP